MHTIKELAVWDIIYEHYSYFTPTSFRRLFKADGFRIERLEESSEGQFRCREAKPAETPARDDDEDKPALDALMLEVAAFFRRYTDKIAAWKCELTRTAVRGQKTVVWGAGSKGVSFINTLKAAGQISHVVDINQRKQAKFVPGTGQETVGPEALTDTDPGPIIIRK